MFRSVALFSLFIVATFANVDIESLKSKAEAGDMEAQYELGMAYATSTDGMMSQKQAAKWFLKAAQQGHAEAIVSMVYRYEIGNGVREDLEEATRWYKKALELGYSRNLKRIEELKDHDVLFQQIDKQLRQPEAWRPLEIDVRHRDCSGSVV